MTRHAQLNNNDHRHLRIDTRRSAALGDDVAFAATFPAEFRDLQAHYPIVFRKDGNGVLSPVALLGFQQGQNLFLEDDGPDGPIVMDAGGFFYVRFNHRVMTDRDGRMRTAFC